MAIQRTCVSLFVTALVATGCVTVRSTDPARTATEMLLLSTAADRAVAKLAAPAGDARRIFLKPDLFEAYDKSYVLATMRERLLGVGAVLVAAVDGADLVVEPRSGALSIDKVEVMIGIPSIQVPIPLAGEFVSPEVALFKRERQRSVAKLAWSAYDARSGKREDSSGPVFGQATHTRWVVLLIGWTTTDMEFEDVGVAECGG